MAKSKKELENMAQEAVRKASVAVKAANEALNEARTALEIMQEVSDSELDQVSGGGSTWSNVPIVKPHPYPVNPDPDPTEPKP